MGTSLEHLKGCVRLARIKRAEVDAIIHHWDTDGIASASLILRSLNQELPVYVPRIGGYDHTSLPVLRERTILILDYGIPGYELDKYYEITRSDIYVIDHHKVITPSPNITYCNPVAAGLGGEREYPACSKLILEVKLKEWSLQDKVIAALGVMGDLAPYYDSKTSHPGLEWASKIAERAGVSVSELRSYVDIIDSSYRMIDEDCIIELVYNIKEKGVKGVEESECAYRNYDRMKTAMTAIEDLLRKEMEKGSMLVYSLKYDMYVTSAIGRKLASENPEKIVFLIHTIPKLNIGFLYIRSITRKLTGLRKQFEQLGFKTGGKEKVVVVEYKPGMENKLLHIIENLEGKVQN
jgi:hypothetical protein